jgi:hypothetical protein
MSGTGYGLFFSGSRGIGSIHGALWGNWGLQAYFHGSFFITTRFTRSITNSLALSGTWITHYGHPFLVHLLRPLSRFLWPMDHNPSIHLGHSFDIYSLLRHSFKHSFNQYFVILYRFSSLF